MRIITSAGRQELIVWGRGSDNVTRPAIRQKNERACTATEIGREHDYAALVRLGEPVGIQPAKRSQNQFESHKHGKWLSRAGAQNDVVHARLPSPRLARANPIEGHDVILGGMGEAPQDLELLQELLPKEDCKNNRTKSDGNEKDKPHVVLLCKRNELAILV